MKKIGFFVTHMLQEGGTKMDRLLTYMKKGMGAWNVMISESSSSGYAYFCVS